MVKMYDDQPETAAKQHALIDKACPQVPVHINKAHMICFVFCSHQVFWPPYSTGPLLSLSDLCGVVTL